MLLLFPLILRRGRGRELINDIYRSEADGGGEKNPSLSDGVTGWGWAGSTEPFSRTRAGGPRIVGVSFKPPTSPLLPLLFLPPPSPLLTPRSVPSHSFPSADGRCSVREKLDFSPLLTAWTVPGRHDQVVGGGCGDDDDDGVEGSRASPLTGNWTSLSC